MSNKYIIKACPNLTTSHYGTGETIHNQCGLTDDDLCANCTDCILKQIVEKCKLFQNNYLVNDGVQLLTTNILNSLDIQECE